MPGRITTNIAEFMWVRMTARLRFELECMDVCLGPEWWA